MENLYRVKFHTIDELLDIPEPRWLIQDILQEQTTAALWGPPNCGKSFIALDWALCVATGTPWLGRYDVLQAPVIYMAGEGSASLQKRVRAWKDANGVDDIGGAYFQIRPLPLREEEVVDVIIHELETMPLPDSEPGVNPGFIVVDTLSQFFGGGDENGPDMALFVNNVRRLSHEQNLSVLMVHHSNATGLRERGHTALRGNIDAMFEAKPHDKVDILQGVSLITDKQRDSAKSGGIALGFDLIQDSLVLNYDEERNKANGPLLRLPPSLWLLLGAFESMESAKTESCAHDMLMEALEIPKTTFHRQLNALLKLNVVKGAGRGKSAITFYGREALRRKDEQHDDE